MNSRLLWKSLFFTVLGAIAKYCSDNTELATLLFITSYILWILDVVIDELEVLLKKYNVGNSKNEKL